MNISETQSESNLGGGRGVSHAGGRLTVPAASTPAEPIIHLLLQAVALPGGPLHILSSNQQETGDSVRPQLRAKAGREEGSFL